MCLCRMLIIERLAVAALLGALFGGLGMPSGKHVKHRLHMAQIMFTIRKRSKSLHHNEISM